MALRFDKNWLKGAPNHALNSETAVLSLFQQPLASDLRGNRAHAESVRTAALSKTDELLVYKGVHQDTFGTNTKRDQVRLDQAHFNVVYSQQACHVYAQPNLSQKWEITEITGG